MKRHVLTEEPAEQVHEHEAAGAEDALQPRRDAHLKHDVEEDVQVVGVQHDREEHAPDGALRDRRPPGPPSD